MTRVTAACCAAILLLHLSPAQAAMQTDAPLVPAEVPASSNPADFNAFPTGNAQSPIVSPQQPVVDEAEKKRREADELRWEAQRKKDEEQKKADEQKRAEQNDKDKEKDKQKEKEKKEPELNLPIRYFVYGAILGGLGALTGILSAGPERDLRDPSKHTTPDATRWLYWRAYYGGFVSKGFYALSGGMAGFASYKTTGAVQDYMKAKAGLAAVSAPVADGAFAATEETVGPFSAAEPPSVVLSPFGVSVRF